MEKETGQSSLVVAASLRHCTDLCGTIRNLSPEKNHNNNYDIKCALIRNFVSYLLSSSLAVPPTLHMWKWSGETSITHSYTLQIYCSPIRS